MKGRGFTFLATVATAVALLLPQPALAAEQKPPRSDSQKIQYLVSEFNQVSGARVVGIAVADSADEPSGAGLGDIINCPPGHHPSPFEMPIYDDNGLFVVGYETVWFCVADDLEPAG